MAHYQNLALQYIGGQWLKGTSTQSIQNINPYSQDIIFKMAAASTVDVDSAYAAAEKAFYGQLMQSAELRKSVIQKLQEVIRARRDEIVGWLIRESGSTRLKANIEVDAALGIVQEAGAFPDKMLTEQLESKDPQRRSFVLRKPLGVIAVISPWNFPFHLSMRSVASVDAFGSDGDCLRQYGGAQARQRHARHRRNAAGKAV